MKKSIYDISVNIYEQIMNRITCIPKTCTIMYSRRGKSLPMSVLYHPLDGLGVLALSPIYFHERRIVMSKLEREYQPHVISRLQKEYPGGIIMKNDAGYRQGYPDLIFTYGKTVHLETKRDINASYRPNQNYYINLINEQGGFARTIRPENEDEVFKQIADYLFDCKIDILSFNENYRKKYLK